MDLLELGSFLAMLYSAIVVFYLAKKFSVRRSFAYLSIILATMLLLHSIHHLGGFVGNAFLEGVFAFASAVMAVFLGVAYSYVKHKQDGLA